MDKALLDMLDDCRELAGIPFVINSAYRCRIYNASVGGAPSSAHLTGHAVDIAATTGQQRLTIIRAALAVGFSRVGIHRRFVHLDTSKTLPDGVCWIY